MIPQKPIINAKEIAERCLRYYWGKDGYDVGSPAWYYSIKWAQHNFSDLKNLQWNTIYKKYKRFLVQE